MNDLTLTTRGLAEIRGRIERDGQPDTDAEIDRADLLAEVDRLLTLCKAHEIADHAAEQQHTKVCAERDQLRATVQRVAKLADTWSDAATLAAALPDADPSGIDLLRNASVRLRAALNGES